MLSLDDTYSYDGLTEHVAIGRIEVTVAVQVKRTIEHCASRPAMDIIGFGAALFGQQEDGLRGSWK